MAWRYLRARKQEGSVSVIAGFSFAGILLGVATLIIVLSVMNGFRTELFDRLIGLNGHMVVYSKTGGVSDYQSVIDHLEKYEDVTHALPFSETQALVQANGGTSGAVVRGLMKEDFQTKPVLGDSVLNQIDGGLANNTVAIGADMASRFGVRLGESISLISPQGKSTPFGVMPRSRSYTVSAVFDVGMHEYNNNFVYMPLETMQKFLSSGDRAESVQIFTTDPDNLDQVKLDIQKDLGPAFGVYTWRDVNGSFANALEVERNVMFLILTLIIIVAAFNIISSMIMLVKDKTHDIAILRTMGATRSSMMRIFILAGASIGFVGTIVGAAAGIAFALNIEAIRQLLQSLTGTELFSDEIYFLSRLPAEIDWTEVMSVIAMAFILSFLATLYPAWRAARLDPVEALRYE
mgnify:CR=1 FL=1